VNTIERTFEATIDEIWDLWTTKDGIESWWGPDGFAVEVRELDLRTGGVLIYAMTAVGAAQIEFMNSAGMPLTTSTQLTYREVRPKTRLAYTLRADFIAGVEPYDVATTVALEERGGHVRLTLTFDSMHDEHWTQMARMGRESELDKLAMRCEALRRVGFEDTRR
jgi:uncharacterized protein YndB with AHSA1/START domain